MILFFTSILYFNINFQDIIVIIIDENFFIEHDIICGNLSRSKLLPKNVNAYVKINVYCEINLSNRFFIVIIMFDCFSFILIYVRSYSFVFVRSH